MKKTTLILAMALGLSIGSSYAQTPAADSLSKLLATHPQADTQQVNLMIALALELQDIDGEKTLHLSQDALKLSQDLNFFPGQVKALRRIGNYYYQRANYQEALRYFEQDRDVAIRAKDSIGLAWALNGIGTIYHSQSNYPKALEQYLASVSVFEKLGRQNDAASISGNAGVLYKEMGEWNSALNYFQKGLKIQESIGNQREIARFLNNIGGVYTDQRQYPQAEQAYMRCKSIAESEGDKHMLALVLRNLVELKGYQDKNREAIAYGFQSLALYKSIDEVEGIADVSYMLALTYLNLKQPDSALYYARQSLSIAKKIGFNRNIHDTYDVLSHIYAAKKNFEQAYQSQLLSESYKDSLIGEDKQNLVASLKFQYELDKKQSEIALLTKDRELQAELSNHQRLKIYALLAGLGLVILLAAILIRANRQKQRANTQLLEQKEEIDGQAHRLQQLNEQLKGTNEQLFHQTETVTAQRDHLEKALKDLQDTQVQLIHREKMASLGELTAGIAHEIQNPLNFVNNFSEVSVELIHEMEKEFENDHKTEGLSLAAEIRQNLEKITHHGKRADNIVKSMLQHSSGSHGQKEPADLNALADEFLRLSYHGQRARDKGFQAILHTDFDPSLGKVDMVAQDISRVLLNLYNNAFYAVMEKKKQLGKDFEPQIWVHTAKRDGEAEIRIRDNGTGIPQKLLDKIFQPFFTTKPPGKGTGLGLSLSYDIVHKNHGGSFTVETKEGEFTEFVVRLPLDH